MRIALITLVVVLVGGGLWAVTTGRFGDQPASSAAARGVHAVQRGSLRITLEERGTLKPLQSAEIRSEIPGKIATMVEEGATVKKDQVLATLDTTDVERQIEQLEGQVIQLEAELKSAETEEEIQRTQNQTDIDKAELNLKVAEADLEKYTKSDVDIERRKHEIGIEEARTNLARAQEQLVASQQLLEEQFVTESQHEETKLKVKQAQNTLETKIQEYEAWKTYQHPIELDKKQAAVEEAKSALARTKQRAAAQMESRHAQTVQKRTALERTRSQLERERERLTQHVLKAPTDGTVLYGSPDRPRDQDDIKVGAQVWPNFVLMTLPDPSEMAVTVDIHEADIGKVKKGMPAFVTSESTPDTIYEGQVHDIARVPNAGRRWGSDNVKRFKVDIRIVGATEMLRPGTSAAVQILVGEKKDVLTVPGQAVYARGGSYSCWKLVDGTPTSVEITVGASNTSWVEVTSGLAEGDEVLLYSPEGGATAANGENGGETDGAQAPPGRGRGGPARNGGKREP